MKNLLFTFFFILFSTAAFAQALEQNKPNLIIDLTEKQAYERFKNSNVRKALKINLKDFNYKELIQYAQADKLSEVVILNSYSPDTIESIKDLYDMGASSLARLRETGTGYPCEDCGMIIYDSLKNLKEHIFYYPKD